MSFGLCLWRFLLVFFFAWSSVLALHGPQTPPTSRRRTFRWIATTGLVLALPTNKGHALTPDTAQEQYDSYAPSYDNVQGVANSLGLDQARRDLLQYARGNVLEIGAGTGQNLPYYVGTDDKVVSLTLVDISNNMLEEARKKSASLKLGSNLKFVRADATSELVNQFGNERFDTVIDTFSLCVMGDELAIQCLKQLKRVIEPRGQLLLLENSRSSNPLLGWYQDQTVDVTSTTGGRGCRYNQDVAKLIVESGWKIQSETQYVSGLFRAYRCTL